MHPLRLMAVGFAILFTMVMYVRWMRRRTLSTRSYQVGFIVLAIIVVLPLTTSF